MRGIHKLKKLTQSTSNEQIALFPEQEEPSLYEKKVALLIARYCYFATLKGSEAMQYSDMLKKLEGEFFISTGRIADILTERAKEISDLRKQALKPSWFKIQWTHLVW